MVPRRPLWIFVGVRESGQASGLVRLQHLHARSREQPKGPHEREDGERCEDGQVEPAHARDEEAGAERSQVDEAATEVRLKEHEQDWGYGQRNSEQRCPQLVDPLDPVGEERCHEEDEQELAELGRLEAEEREVDPAP